MTASPLRMRILGLMFVGILLSLVVISPLGVKSTDVAQAGSPNAIQNLPGCLQNLLPIEDDNSSGPVNPGFQLVNNKDVPQMAEEYARAFKVSRALPCDIPLGSHPGMYNMADKYARLAKTGENPYIDPAGYKAELDLDEAMYHAVLDAQVKAAAAAK